VVHHSRPSVTAFQTRRARLEVMWGKRNEWVGKKAKTRLAELLIELDRFSRRCRGASVAWASTVSM